MRGIAALAVMFHHFTQHTSSTIFPNAGLAVDLFFCLSGFVIAFSYQDRLLTGMTLSEFAKKRLIRLYPMFLVGVVIGAIALFWKIADGKTNYSYLHGIKAIALNTFYLPHFADLYVQIGNNRIYGAIFPSNDPAWSLFFELVINIVFAVMVIALIRLRTLFALVVSGALVLTAYVELTGSSPPGWGSSNFIGGFPRVFFGFASGVLIHTILGPIKLRIAAASPLIVVMITICMFIVPVPKSWLRTYWLLNTLVTISFLVALGAIANPQGKRAKEVFDYLGWISYPIYCIHFPLYSLYTSMAGNADTGLSGAVICSLATIGSAHVLAKYFDEPARAVLSRRFVDKFPVRAPSHDCRF
jgi:peptidoglycan/LPS O-acetylase OafA/YrhL